MTQQRDRDAVATGTRDGEVALRVENLRVSFRAGGNVVRVVDGVDLTVKEGRTLGLVGESGSGKSVTAMSILDLLGPSGAIEDGSRVVFRDTELTGMSEPDIRALRGNEISMIFQEPMTSLNPVMRIGDQIAEVLRLHTKVTRSEARGKAVDMLQQVGISPAATRARNYPHQLSGGQRQRVMIAMALICQPTLLIADEPTTALDITIQAQVLQLLRTLRAARGMSMLLITHDLGVVAEMADDVAVMYAGKVVEYGSVDAILRAPQHPYTRALIESIPKLAPSDGAPLKTIAGTVPSPQQWAHGCRFASRCPFAFDKCHEIEPELFNLPRQASACWLNETGEPIAARAVANTSPREPAE